MRKSISLISKMDQLKAEIARKRKELADTSVMVGGGLLRFLNAT